MGANSTKRACLPFEDATKRMSDEELKRVCETFKRLSGGHHLLPKHAFVAHVLGDGVPQPIAEWLYAACGGTSRGIALKDLVCGLVLLTKGRPEEKIRFLFALYSNDSGTYVSRNEFFNALRIEGAICADEKISVYHPKILSLFPPAQDKISYEHFAAWIQTNKDATVLSKWLLSNTCSVSLSSDVEAPTFYQTLAGVTHLEEQDICELEKCFWTLQSASPTLHLDLNCVKAMVCPPVPVQACEGLFKALDVNGDGHVDFKELCCGISAACRGPTAERMKFCFKIFDEDRDCRLNHHEMHHMVRTLTEVALENARFENEIDVKNYQSDIYESLQKRLDVEGVLSQEEFLVWAVEDDSMVKPMLELLFQVCHVSFVLRPHCRHHEHDIVTGWLEREERRGYHVGQFWYLISSDWWRSWLAYTTAPRTNHDHCSCRPQPIEEGIVCDESLLSSNGTGDSMESMGDLLGSSRSGSGAGERGSGSGGGDSCSIASSSGVSSSSASSKQRQNGGQHREHQNGCNPGPIENSSLVAEPTSRVVTLTGEGGRLKKDQTLVHKRDFELVPELLWKALAHWYGGPLPLPRQVILAPGGHHVELELYPLNLNVLRHQNCGGGAGVAASTAWNTVVGGYGAAALSTAGLTASSGVASPRRYLAHTAAFSRLANIRQVIEFLCSRLALRFDEVRLWHVKDSSTLLLEDEQLTLQELGVQDGDKILLEVRNKDLTWPEELGALASGSSGGVQQVQGERRPTISLPPGATGLQNLGNTCFMNAALQAVSNTRPLTIYFQMGELCELNCFNPLGTKGVVAKRYAELCRELWAGSKRSIVPLNLRACVTKHAPHLGGGGQHDSQELLAWLLDALHEDLNRVARKHYTELKDSGGRPDEVVADEAWNQHLARDDSIITDLFYGQLKSKVTCQTCGHESVRFDPFNLLSLPLPMESYVLCEVLVVRLSGETPIKYGMRLNSEAKYYELKQQLHQLCQIKPERLLLAEVASSQIKHILDDFGRINPNAAKELYAYEIPANKFSSEDHDKNRDAEETCNNRVETETETEVSDSPLARSPETKQSKSVNLPLTELSSSSSRSPSPSVTNRPPSAISESPEKPHFLVALHRKTVRQETYFLTQQKSKPSLFGVPLLIGYHPNVSCQSLYERVWSQVTRLLSPPPPQSDQNNHATDCDDSLGYEFPFQLKAVLQGGQICAVCHWTRFCRGCTLPCSDELLNDKCKSALTAGMCIAIDWDPTALHLRYQSSREKVWIEDESVQKCRKLHTEPIDLDYCLRAFTSEERLETKYHCSNCQDKQPATKKLQIWRLPPILIIHLKRFDYVNNRWVKTHKVVNFPFKNFDPTEYLASVPQETILRHRHLSETPSSATTGHGEDGRSETNERAKLLSNNNINAADGNISGDDVNSPKTVERNRNRTRLESTSLLKTPIVDEHLKDYHGHKLLPGQDPFDLKYQLYAVVSHSGLLNGGHYISYACNPNGNWYCYNDSSCREVFTENPTAAITSTTSRIRGKKKRKKCSSNLSETTMPTTSSSEEDKDVESSECEEQNEEEVEEEEEEGPEQEKEKEVEKDEPEKCEVKIPKIDTSAAYILFYERSGLDYKPYLPESTEEQMKNHVAAATAANLTDLQLLDENDSKQLCSVQ